MAKSDPKVGDTRKVTAPTGIGAGFGAIPAGTEMTVEEVVDGDTPGVGGTEKSVLLRFEEPGLVLDKDGNPKQGSITRHFSMNVSDFSNYFEGE